MTGLLRRVPTRSAMGVLVFGVLVLLTCVGWLAYQGHTNMASDRQQASEISANQDRLDGVSSLARDLKDGLTKANRRLRANGVEPVTVPTAAVAGQAGTNGVSGLPGADGLDGSAGAPGSPGKSGSDGIDGTPGTLGSTGAAGPIGPQGPKGETGDTGQQGQAGKDGANGQDGAAGQPGAPGADGQPPSSFTFTDALGVSYRCSDPDGDANYSCEIQ